MAKCALLLLCLLGIALALSSAIPVDTNGEPTPVPPLKEEKTWQGTPTSNPHGNAEEVLSGHQDQQQVGRTQATPTQTRMGRAASTPSKKASRPCPGCFSVIGDPGTAQREQ